MQGDSLGKIFCVRLTGVDSDICLLIMTPTSLYWGWIWDLCNIYDTHLCKCENARWSGPASLFSRQNYLCILTGVDSDICLLMMTLTVLCWGGLWYMCTCYDQYLCKCENARLVLITLTSGYWLWLEILLLYMCSQISSRFIRFHSQLRAHFR